jgi:hypothetical protein
MVDRVPIDVNFNDSSAAPQFRYIPMAHHNKIEPVVEVEVNKTNASIKSIHSGLSSMEQAAAKAARGALPASTASPSAW